MNTLTRASAIGLGLWLIAGCSSSDKDQTDSRADGSRRDGVAAVDGPLAADGTGTTDAPPIDGLAPRDGKPAADTGAHDAASRDGALRDGTASDGGAQCGRPSDCRLFSDYCEGCNCRALGVHDADPKCEGTIVTCFADPCMGKQADCSPAGRCVVK
jgi:hypothetical protein